MPDRRTLGKYYWDIAAIAEKLDSIILKDSKVFSLFKGAASLSDTTNRLVRVVMQEQPEIFKDGSLSDETILRALSVSFSHMVMKSLEQGSLPQKEHLICTLALHFAEKNYEPPLKQELKDVCLKIITLHQQWSVQIAQQRHAQRNMLRTDNISGGLTAN
ncbi:hypothetical protein [Shewanella sp. TC10]|uniref:hypothetical protein n=1 Tax=Shewanella sp. TC10 TaxID=1419739 RepID=UPI00129D96FA|nr:hypothetical protein [Shewanella sp. TC10]